MRSIICCLYSSCHRTSFSTALFRFLKFSPNCSVKFLLKSFMTLFNASIRFFVAISESLSLKSLNSVLIFSLLSFITFWTVFNSSIIEESSFSDIFLFKISNFRLIFFCISFTQSFKSVLIFCSCVTTLLSSSPERDFRTSSSDLCCSVNI